MPSGADCCQLLVGQGVALQGLGCVRGHPSGRLVVYFTTFFQQLDYSIAPTIVC
jgi:hypothetical protein